MIQIQNTPWNSMIMMILMNKSSGYKILQQNCVTTKMSVIFKKEIKTAVNYSLAIKETKTQKRMTDFF